VTAVKICGLTRQEDAEAAARFGADFVGFILWPGSLRAMTVDRVRPIVSALPSSVTPVGVFVDPTTDAISAAADAGIKIAQVLTEKSGLPQGVRIPIVRVVHFTADSIEPNVADDLILLDAYDPVTKGGTGKTIDWERAAEIARVRRVILAGGLKPSNVREAIARVTPYAVDVASGVESSPGIKDHSKVEAFIRAAKETM
jgi:phosphoribosylanthranilate isomerase